MGVAGHPLCPSSSRSRLSASARRCPDQPYRNPRPEQRPGSSDDNHPGGIAVATDRVEVGRRAGGGALAGTVANREHGCSERRDSESHRARDHSDDVKDATHPTRLEAGRLAPRPADEAMPVGEGHQNVDRVVWLALSPLIVALLAAQKRCHPFSNARRNLRRDTTHRRVRPHASRVRDLLSPRPVDHAATGWYSCMSPPSTSRRRTSSVGTEAPAEPAGMPRPMPR